MSVSQKRLAAVQNFHLKDISLCKDVFMLIKGGHGKQKKEETLSEMNWGVCSDFEESHGSEMSSVETGTRMSHLWRRGRMFAENKHTRCFPATGAGDGQRLKWLTNNSFLK